MHRRPIRVLQLRDSPWLDGPGRTILETAAHLEPSRVRYHVAVLVSDEGGENALVEALRGRGASVFELADHGGLDRGLIAEIERLVAQLEVDVLHSSEFRTNVLAQLCRIPAHVRRVSTAHGWIANTPRAKVMRLLDKCLLRRFDAVVLVSHAMRRLVPSWWLPDRRVTVIHNALVLETYGSDVAAAPRRAVDPHGQVTVLNVGRLSPEKGQDLLLQAVAAVARDWPGLRLSFAGTGPEEANLRALTHSLGLDKKVEFLSYVRDMPSLYARTDLLVQSSLTEGLPNVILEAAYLRVPIVATAVGGTAEVVEHERSAWLVPAGSTAALEAGIRRFLERPEDFATMARTAHTSMLTSFSFRARTERLTAFYESLVAEPVQ